MNNKGFTVVELLVSFVLVMTISIGLFKVADSYREKQQQESYKKVTQAYANEILTKIQTDVIDGGGIVSVIRLNGRANKYTDELNVQQDNPCYQYSQGIKFKLRSGQEVELCVGNGVYNENKNGVLYGQILYKKPSNFIQIIDDILINESDTYDYNGVISKKLWNINIRIKHLETKEVYNINVTSPQAVIPEE